LVVHAIGDVKGALVLDAHERLVEARDKADAVGYTGRCRAEPVREGADTRAPRRVDGDLICFK
jgi:hypothetical protein